MNEIAEMVKAIPKGWVRTYKDVNPKAPRSVGRELSGIEEDIPWHRVVRADGSLPLGDTQRKLLEAEDVPMRGEKVDMDEARLPVPPGVISD